MGPVALVLSSSLSRSSLFCLAVVALEDDFLCTSGTPGKTARAHGGLAERVRGSSKKYPKRARECLMPDLYVSEFLQVVMCFYARSLVRFVYRIPRVHRGPLTPRI